MIAVGIHPFLVHLLIAGCTLYLLVRGPRTCREAFSGVLRPLSVFLTVLVPLVFLAGVLARHLILVQVPGAAGEIRFHLWTGILMILVWWPLVWKTSRADEGTPLSSVLHPVALVFAALVLLMAATAGGWLVYGPHAISFPLR